MILTASGLMAIENIKAGDKVISTNPETLETAEKTVLETYVHGTNKLVHLTINSEETITTVDHSFYVKEYGFIKAGVLWSGAEVINSNGAVYRLENIHLELVEKPQKVYNFQVEDFHTYHVGYTGIYVHNQCTRETPRIEDGNSKEGWEHIENRHITGRDPGGDLFAPGTTRGQLEQAARLLVKKGRLVTDPLKVIQIFEKKIVVNGLKDLVRVVVDSTDANRVITIFPVRGGGSHI